MKQKLRWALGATIAIALCLLFVFYPIEPSGRYAEPSIGSEGLAFLELTNGQARLVTPRGRKANDGYEFQNLAKYQKKGGEWVWILDDGSESKIKATLLHITIDQPNHRPWVMYRMNIYALATLDFDALKY